ncbi:MAG: hypothetical protein ACP5F9_03300 [Thiomonas sp.]|jgi:hypothetical protein
MPEHKPDPPRPLPAAVRKQILLARMAVERVEFVQAFEQFRSQARPAALLSRAVASTGLGALGAFNPVSAALGLLRFTRGHPYLGSLLGSTASFLLRRRAARAALSGMLKLGLATAVLLLAARVLQAGARRK